MAAPRWTEAPKVVKFHPDTRQLEIDPGGGWGADGGSDATSWAVNLAQNGQVVWGSREDLGPPAVGGTRPSSPRGDGTRLPGQFFEGERILIPVPDTGGRFDVQVWGAAPTSTTGLPNGDPIWEWGRVNIFGQPAFLRNIVVPAKATTPPTTSPAGLTLPEARKQMIAVAESATFPHPAPLSRVAVAHLVLNAKDDVWLDAQQAVPKAIRELLEPQ